MVEFGKKMGTEYNMSMDREYGHTNIAHDGNRASPSNNSTNDVGVGIKDLGMSLLLGPVPNVIAVGAKLRAGMKTLELGFSGTGKGSGQSQTPEFYGVAQRRALQEIGRANEVNFTTHATVGIQGLAGMDQQGNFSKASKDFSIQELKRAIEFAADVAQGGPVVIHTGEFQRPIVDADWNQEGNYKDKFEMYEDEKERASFRVVDDRTGAVIQEARKNRKVSRPIWNRYEEGNTGAWSEQDGKSYTDSQGVTVKKGDYIDYFGNKITPEDRVPRFNSDKSQFEVVQLNWDDLIYEAKEMTDRAKEAWREWKSGKISDKDFEKSYWARFRNVKDESKIRVRAEEAYIISTLETNAANSRGWAHYYGGSFDDYVDNMKKLKKAYEFYKKIEETIDPEEKWRLQQQTRSTLPGLIPEDAKNPTEIIKQAMKDTERQMKQSQEASASQWAQAEESVETIRHVQSAEDYALKEAYDSYAQAGISAMRQSDKMERQKKLKKPITVAMENLFPESYGSHPNELIDLVLGSRKKMVKLLQTKYSYSVKQAEKEAKEHITSTLDVGHINIWRKYWKGDPKKTIEENDLDFDNWSVNKVAEMTKKGIIGHVHLDDNFGYHDDHLAPGEGNTPIKAMIKALKDNGYEGELIVEPGADYTTDVSGFHSVMKAWKLFGSPVYGAGAGAGISSRGWGDVGYGHFGRNQPPYFIFGAYSPSEDWTFWSGVPLE